MKTSYLLVLISSFVGLTSQASSNIQVQCNLSTRVEASALDLKINLENKYLGYHFEKYNASIPSQNYKMQGSNQEGFGSSPLSKSSVSIVNQAQGQIAITGQGLYYNGSVPVGKTEIKVILTKTPYKSLGYHLKLFQVNGAPHQSQGQAFCSVNTLQPQANFMNSLKSAQVQSSQCKVAPQSDCSTGPKRICCYCISGQLSCV